MRTLATALALALLAAGCQFSALSGEPADGGADADIPDVGPPPSGFEVVTVHLRDGAAYDGSRDNWIIEEISEVRGGGDTINWDRRHTEGFFGTNRGESAALIAFDVFGSGELRVPPAAPISRALLILHVADPSADGADLYDALVPWDESSTWQTFGPVAGIQEEDFDPDSAVEVPVDSTGQVVIDVTASVQRWSDGAPAHGWLIRARGDDGTDVHSRESGDELVRPGLQVAYLQEVDDPE